MNPDELFKRFFGSSPFPEFGYRGYGHSNDDADSWSQDQQRGDIFSDWHQEIHRQMEDMDRQMRDVFRIFRIAEIPSIPALPDGMEDHSARKKSPRDFMLKDGHDDRIIRSPRMEPEPRRDIVPSQPEDEVSSLFEKFFNIPRWNRIRPQDKQDTDLDGETPSGSEIADLFKGDGEAQRPVKEPSNSNPWGFFGHNSVSIKTVIGADGVVEERRTVRDSSGREETTVTRRMGDSSHSVTTVKDDTGKVEKHETFHNVDKDNLSDFERHWAGKGLTGPRREDEGSTQNSPSPPSNPLSNDTRSIFRRFFGFSSK